MSVKIGAWNVSGALGKPEMAPVVLEMMQRIGADVWVLSEALDINEDLLVREDFERDGFEVQIVDREITDTRGDKMLVVLNRLGPKATKLALAHRQGASADISLASDGKAIRVVGAHFDDRREQSRLDMAQAFIDYKNANPNVPTILAGDINAMHGDDDIAKLLQSRRVRLAAFLIPMPRNLDGRLVAMADGRTMALLEQADMQDADSLHQPTMHYPIIPGVQLDHIMHPSEVRATNFEAHATYTNHRAITATIET